jgi:hypothetical protein
LAQSWRTSCSFEQLAHREDLARLLRARLGHEGATSRVQAHEAVAAQAVERLPHQGARDLEQVGQLLLDQLGAGHQPALDDGRGQGLDDAIGLVGGSGCFVHRVYA